MSPKRSLGITLPHMLVLKLLICKVLPELAGDVSIIFVVISFIVMVNLNTHYWLLHEYCNYLPLCMKSSDWVAIRGLWWSSKNKDSIVSKSPDDNHKICTENIFLVLLLWLLIPNWRWMPEIIKWSTLTLSHLTLLSSTLIWDSI